MSWWSDAPTLHGEAWHQASRNLPWRLVRQREPHTRLPPLCGSRRRAKDTFHSSMPAVLIPVSLRDRNL